MTLIAAYKSAHGRPVLLGDTMCGIKTTDTFYPTFLRKKVYQVGSNLVVGWTGFEKSAKVVMSGMMNEFDGALVTQSDLDSYLTNLPLDQISDKDVTFIGWLVDGEEKCFIWHSYWPSQVNYDREFVQGSGAQFFKTVREASVLAGGDPGDAFSEDVAAVQKALSFSGEIFFQEVMDPVNWQQSFGFAYEVFIYTHEKFWPLGDTVYVGWEYRWDPETEKGRAMLSPFLAKLNFREHYSVLQRVLHHKLRIKSCRNYPIRPAYDYTITEDIKKLRFTLNADHYIHYFVLHPPVNGQVFRLVLVTGKSRKGDKVWVGSQFGKTRFEVDTAKLDEMFGQAVRVRVRPKGRYLIPDKD